MWPYLEQIPTSIRSQWISKLTAVAQALGIRPEWLMVVMYQESKLNPAARNGTVAVGLIQFTTSGAASVGTTKADILKMGYIRQLDYVQKYFENVMKSTGPLRSIGEVYMATFLPSKVRAPLDTVLARKGQGIYAGNSGLDVTDDGILTKRDVVSFIHGKIPLEDRESVAFSPGGVPSSLAPTAATDGTVYGEPDDRENDSKGDPSLKDEDYGQSGETEISVTQTTWFPYVLVGMAAGVVVLFSAVVFRHSKPA